MSSPSPTSTLTRRTNIILIGLFLILLWLPTLDTAFHIDWTPPRSENRAMAVFPNAPKNWRGAQAYVAGIEAWFNDHFGFRKCLVMWNNKLRWALFKDKGTREVLVGKNGWLFYSGAQMIDHYSGQLQFTPEQLHDWQRLLEQRRDWLAKRGIKYLFVVPPDKQTIYPEELPDWVKKVRPQTKLDQFFAYMHAHSTVPVLDVRKVVWDAKQIYPTYLKTDTHWNLFGGFVSYQELLRSMAELLPGMKLDPLPLTSFSVTNRLQPGGDLARMLGLSLTESNAYILVPKPELPSYTTILPPADHPTEPAFSTNRLAKGSLIFFHDSFAGAWSPYLGYHFNHITYLWQYDFDPAWVERDKPDLVATEMLERFFYIEDPRKMMAKEAQAEAVLKN